MNSVQLLRRLDSRIPAPLLSAHISTTGPPPGLGKLADLKSLKGPGLGLSDGSGGAGASGSGSGSSSWRLGGGSTPPQRGWASTVAGHTKAGPGRSSSPVTTPQMTPTRTLTPLGGGRSQAVGVRTASPVPRGATPAPAPAVIAASTTVEGNVPDSWEDEV